MAVPLSPMSLIEVGLPLGFGKVDCIVIPFAGLAARATSVCISLRYAASREIRRARAPDFDHLDGMHTFRGHPMATIPRAGVDRLSLAGNIANSTVGGMVAKVRCLAPCIVAQKYTRPTVGVHGFGRASRGQRDMDDANECVLKNNSVTSRSGFQQRRNRREIQTCLDRTSKHVGRKAQDRL